MQWKLRNGVRVEALKATVLDPGTRKSEREIWLRYDDGTERSRVVPACVATRRGHKIVIVTGNYSICTVYNRSTGEETFVSIDPFMHYHPVFGLTAYFSLMFTLPVATYFPSLISIALFLGNLGALAFNYKRHTKQQRAAEALLRKIRKDHFRPLSP